VQQETNQEPMAQEKLKIASPGPHLLKGGDIQNFLKLELGAVPDN
jgi:hypothetical protein